MKTFGQISLRESFGKALVKAGKRYSDLRVLDAGTKNSTMSNLFEKEYSDKFTNVGINEPGMVALATGMAMTGKRVVACDMSIFLTHAFAQIQTAARQNDIHMILATSHTGISVGPDGGSAHDITDLARMRTIPNLKIITPWDGWQTEKALNYALENKGLYYLRLNRPAVPIFTEEESPFNFGEGEVLRTGNNITIIAIGDKVYNALEASDKLGNNFAEVIGVHTLEPLDERTILKSVVKTGKVITVEDHMYVGGLYESVAGILAEKFPTAMRRVSLQRTFTTSGDPDELSQIYNMNTKSIINKIVAFTGITPHK